MTGSYILILGNTYTMAHSEKYLKVYKSPDIFAIHLDSQSTLHTQIYNKKNKTAR